MWKLAFEVVEGDHMGRLIFDNLVFKTAGFQRVKSLCRVLGLDVSGQLDLRPDSIRGGSCYVTVDIEEYEDRHGDTQKRNKVAFDGFASVKGAKETTDEGGTQEDDDLPF
jgi:hypothetical protein